MTACFKGRKRPLTQEDVESLEHPGALTKKLEAFSLEGEIHVVTECARIAGSSSFQRVRDVEIPEDAELLLTIDPGARAE